MESYLPRLSESGRRWLRFLALLAAVALLCGIVFRLRRVFTPLAAAAASAYVLNPCVAWLERWARIPRLATVVVIFTVSAVLLLCGGLFLYGQGVAQVQQFQENLPGYLDRIGVWLAEYPARLQAAGAPGQPTTDAAGAAATGPADWWRSATPLIREHGLGAARQLLHWTTTGVSNAMNLLSWLVLVPMFTFFFLWRFGDGVRLVHDHLPAAYRPTIVHVVQTIDRAVANFFRGRLVVCAIIGVLNAVGWTIVGVPYSLPLGLLAGTLNLVPFMSLLALPPVLLFTYFDRAASGAPWLVPVLLATGVYMAVQALESLLLSPAIEGQASGLHPLAIVVALLIGAELAGLLGMLLAIPVASTLRTLAAEFVLPEIRRLARPPDAGPGGPPAAGGEGP